MTAPFNYRTLCLRLRKNCPFTKGLFVKPHSFSDVDSSDPYDGKALFVSGIPRSLQPEHLHEIFQLFGSVLTIVLHPKGSSGVVVFETCASLEAAMTAAVRGNIVDYPLEEATEACGLKALVEEHKAQYPGTIALQDTLNEWTEEFEGEEERRRIALESASADDGWTLVTNKAGRKRSAGATVSGGVAQAAAQAHADRKKPKLAADFYKHQAREQKKNELVELRKQFADAQKQVQEMRAARTFKPGAVTR